MTTIATNKIKTFGKGVHRSEGVLIDRDGYVFGFGLNRIVYRVSPGGDVEEFATLPDGSVPNGVAMDTEGNFVYCCLGKRALMRLSRDGKASLLADRAGPVPLTLPNFLSYDANGNLYASVTSTMRDLSRIGEEVLNPQPNGALVRLRPDGSGELIADGLFLANGTAISPDESAVYVLESGRKDCLRIPLRKDGTAGKPEIYSENFPAIPDGMAFAASGNLYVTLIANKSDGTGKEGPVQLNLKPANQIIKVNPNGEWELLIDDRQGTELCWPSNCAFGGLKMKNLYIANAEGDHFSCIELSEPGHPLYHQR